MVEILLDHKAEIEAQSERTKDTPLSLACSGGRYEVVEILLARNANKEHRNVSDYTPLSLAASGGYVNIIKLLLAHGAEINSRTGSKLGISPLMLAAMNGHTAAVKLLLDMGSDINAQIETNRNTALTLACFQGRHEVVSLLLDRRANVEHRAKTGLTPLMEAASGGYIEVGRVLLDKGADVNAPPVPTSRDTALTIAADKGHYRFVELLITRGAQVDARNKKGNSSLWLAANGGHLDVVQLLYSAGADIDSQDNRKVSCLMAAFRKGHSKTVKWMVKHVTQFPSDAELTRYIATIGPADKDLLKKCNQCMEIIKLAKDRQAAEAAKNASSLLEELDRESKLEQSKKEAAARKREKKKKKKMEKMGKKQEEEAANAKKDESDDDEDEKVPEKPEKEKNPEALSVRESINAAAVAAEGDSGIDANSQGSSSAASTSAVQEKEDAKAKEATAAAAAAATAVAAAAAAEKRSKRSKNKKNKEPEPEQPLRRETERKSTSNGSTNSPPHQQQQQQLGRQQQQVQQTDQDNLRVPCTPESHNFINSFTSPVSSSVCEQGRKGRNRRGGGGGDKGNETSPAAANAGGKKQGKQDKIGGKGAQLQGASEKSKLEPQLSGQAGSAGDWKEVVRKSKKVSVPANAISRVIGRGGCNINAIRELSGAHIEVEKQSKSGAADRTILIKGSADATRQANAWIQSIITCPDKDLADIVGKQQLKALQQQQQQQQQLSAGAAAGVVGQAMQSLSINSSSNAASSAAAAASPASGSKQNSTQSAAAKGTAGAVINTASGKSEKGGRNQHQSGAAKAVTANANFVNGQPAKPAAGTSKTTSFAAVAGGSASVPAQPSIVSLSSPSAAGSVQSKNTVSSDSTFGMIATGGPPKSQQQQAAASTQAHKNKSGVAAAASPTVSVKDSVNTVGSGDPKDYSPFKLSGAPVSSGAPVIPTAAVPIASGRPESKDFSPFNFSWGAGVGQAASGIPSSGNNHQPLEEIWGNETNSTKPQQGSGWGDISKAPGYRASNNTASTGWGTPPLQQQQIQQQQQHQQQQKPSVAPPMSNKNNIGEQFYEERNEERCNSAPGTPISPPGAQPQTHVNPIGPPPPSSAAASSKSPMSPVGSEPEQFRSPSATSHLLAGYQGGANGAGGGAVAGAAVRSMTPEDELNLRGAIGQIGHGASVLGPPGGGARGVAGGRPSSVVGMENKVAPSMAVAGTGGFGLQQPPPLSSQQPPASLLPPPSSAGIASRAPGFGANVGAPSTTVTNTSASSILQENVLNAASQLAAFGDQFGTQGFGTTTGGGDFRTGFQPAPGGGTAGTGSLLSSTNLGRFSSNPPPGPPGPPPAMFSQQQNSRNDFLHGSTPNSDYLRRGGTSQHVPPSRNAPPPQMPQMGSDFGQFGQPTANRNSGGFDNYGASTSILNNQSINSLLSGTTNSSYGADLSSMLAGKTLQELMAQSSGSGSAAGGEFGSRANDLSSALSNMSFQSDGMNSVIGGGSGGGGSKFSRPIGAERHRGHLGSAAAAAVAPGNPMMRHPPPSMTSNPAAAGNSPWSDAGGSGALYGDSSAAPSGGDMANGFGSTGFSASLAGHTLDGLINGDYGSGGGSPAVGMSPNVTPNKDATGVGYGDYLAMQQQSGGKKVHPGGMGGYGDPASIRKNMASNFTKDCL